MAFAQASKPGGKEDAGSGGPQYVGPYFTVIFVLGLGLFLVCNPSRRRDRPKPEQYEDRAAGAKPKEEKK
jgi:hypothetical protein